MKTLKKIWDLVKEFVIVILVTTFVFSFPAVSGNSMLPTLRHGERMFIPKYETFLHRMGIGEFKRGDIIVFKPPADHRSSWMAFPSREVTWWHFIPYYVKRVVAVGGDNVRIEQGRVFVNGEEVDFRTIENFWTEQGCWENQQDAIAANHIRADDQTGYHTKIFTVPQGQYFVMGDNRSPGGSEDSRFFGPVPLDRIAGRVSYMLFPLWRKTEVANACFKPEYSGSSELNLRKP
ncbi:signal peptidase I [Deinococcus cellulosilyticus]|uniref:Signal peptidase I n=1 Tax=Deinococcus cellulosilyticus (strain DSM 18568 / NBRC 106333 / KACC 11606 / 5516J-15) TaxID=1223518 RepID=A0A511N062_DEIC1|nr:signal peptidase I [Deinococcus cellulosilyticus]GEM45827.1 signal peptidase I [Deinococcus cellulosilyticus NBRC 106333 = KACC 11606]